MSDRDLAELYQRRRRELGIDGRPQAAVESAIQAITAPLKRSPIVCGECRPSEGRQREQEQRDAAERAWQEALARFRIDPEPVLTRVGVPAHFMFARFDECPDLPAKLVAAVRAWADRPEGIALLYGPPGAGKTWCAVAAIVRILEARIFRSAGCRFISESGYLDVLKAGFGRPDVSPRRLPASAPRRVKLLVFDEIGGSALTEWGRGEVGRLVAERHAADLPTILTSNIDLDGLARAVDPRIASRIAESRAVLEFPRRDLRMVGAIRR